MKCTLCRRDAHVLHIVSKDVKICPQCLRNLIPVEERHEYLERSA